VFYSLRSASVGFTRGAVGGDVRGREHDEEVDRRDPREGGEIDAAALGAVAASRLINV